MGYSKNRKPYKKAKRRYKARKATKKPYYIIPRAKRDDEIAVLARKVEPYLKGVPKVLQAAIWLVAHPSAPVSRAATFGPRLQGYVHDKARAYVKRKYGARKKKRI